MSSKHDGDHADKSQRGVELEDKETELWAPVARRLFGSQIDAGPPAPESAEDLPPEEHDTEIMQGASDTVEMPPDEAARVISEAVREHADTDEVPAHVLAQALAGASADPEEKAISGEYEAPDTMEMPAHEAAMAVAEAEHELLTDSVRVTGEEGEAAVRLAAQEQQARRYDPSATMVVDRPRNLPKLSHECRMCGRRVSRPGPKRLRGPTQSEHGFRCEQCKNVFCASHVVRVSGLWESLMSGGRFRCQLCLPEATFPKE